jgi:hypothetical protein
MILLPTTDRIVNALMGEFVENYDKITIEELDEAFVEFKRCFVLVREMIKEKYE